MRKNRKSSSHTHRNRIYITAFLLAGSFILGGCIIKKEKEADSKLPEIVIGIDYFEPYSYQTIGVRFKCNVKSWGTVDDVTLNRISD